MKLEDQVCSFELAKKLKELGATQISLFYWNNKNKLITSPIYFKKRRFFALLYNISAFTVAELGEMLPDCIHGEYGYEAYIKSQKKDNEYKIYLDNLDKIAIFFSENEANARAKMLIHLIENNLIRIKDVKNET